MPEHPRVVTDHPLTSRSLEEIRGDGGAGGGRRRRRSGRCPMTVERGIGAPPGVDRLDIPLDPGEANDLLEERGWTDGLPVIPPTVSPGGGHAARTRRMRPARCSVAWSR